MTTTAPAILGVDAADLEELLSRALDKLDLQFEESDIAVGYRGGYYLDGEYQLTVKLTGYEAVPTSHTFTYRRAISGDDAIEIQYRTRLTSYNAVTEVAVYSLTEVE